MGDVRPEVLDLFRVLKQGNRKVTLEHEDLEVRRRDDLDMDLSDIPDGTWFWSCIRDEASGSSNLPVERVRLLDPGLARTGRGDCHIFGGDGAVAALDLRGGKLLFRRRHVDSVRRAEERRRMERGRDRDKQWLNRQERSRKEACAPVTAAGMRESSNTAVYLFNKRLIATFEAGRPYKLDRRTLETIGPLGEHGPVTAPWLRRAVTLPYLGPEVASLTPMTLNTAHPGIDKEASYWAHYQYLRPDREPDTVHDDNPTHRANLWVTVFASGDKVPAKRVRILEAKTGKRAELGWGAHQCMVTAHWFIIMDSGFVAEKYQYREGSPRGVPPTNTVLWFVPKARLRRAKPGGSVSAYRMALPGKPTIHGHCDYRDGARGKAVRMWAIGNRYFDASEWVRKGDMLRAGEEAPREAWGLPTTDMSPEGEGQTIYDLTIDPTAGRIERLVEIPALRGTALAAEPPVAAARLSGLWWFTTGTFPELDTVAEANRWALPLDRVPKPRNAAIFRTLRGADSMDRVWESAEPRWASGPALAPFNRRDVSEGWIFTAAVCVDKERGTPVQELSIFHTPTIDKGPAFTIRSRNPNALSVGFGLHGLWVPA